MSKIKVFKTLRLHPHSPVSLVDALKTLGEYEREVDDGLETVSDVAALFEKEPIALEEAVDVHLAKVEGRLVTELVSEKEWSKWLKDQGLKDMSLRHALAVGAQYPDASKEYPIWTLGSVRNRLALVTFRHTFSLMKRGNYFASRCLFGVVK